MNLKRHPKNFGEVVHNYNQMMKELRGCTGYSHEIHRMQEIKDSQVYVVTTNSDRTEGRGRTIPIGTYADIKNATEASAGKGVMGTDADIEAQIKFTLGGNCFNQVLFEPLKDKSEEFMLETKVQDILSQKLTSEELEMIMKKVREN